MMIRVLFICLALNVLVEAHDPCATLKEGKHRDFLKQNSDLLYTDPVGFMKEDVPRGCDLEHVDPLMIAPGKGKKHVWVTFLGDSLNRHLFYELAPRFSNFVPKEGDNVGELLEHTFPLLGPHQGPPSDADLGDKLSTFHNHKLLCCKNIYARRNSIDDQDNCVYGMQSRGDSVGFNAKGASHYDHYLFENIADFVDYNIAEKFGDDFTCLSMIWGPTYGSAQDQLQLIYDGKHKYVPDAIIMNMGIHQFDTDEHNTQMFKNYTDHVYEQFKTTMIYHSPVAIDESNDSYGSTATPSDMKKLIHLVGDKVNNNKWPSMSKYLNLYDFSSSEHRAGCSEDGIHFLSKESIHNALISQWDLNWLVKLGVIDHDYRTIHNLAEK